MSTLKQQMADLTNRILILEKMVAHILYTEPRGEEDEDDMEIPYPDPESQRIFDEHKKKAWQVVSEAGKASTSYLQRKFGIGYNNAAKLMDWLEGEGIIGENDGSNMPRVVLKKYQAK